MRTILINFRPVRVLIAALLGFAGGIGMSLAAPRAYSLPAPSTPAVPWHVRLASLSKTGEIAMLPSAIMTAWTPTGQITMQANGRIIHLQTSALLSMRRLVANAASSSAAMPLDLWWLYLRTGDIFPGQPLATAGGKLIFNSVAYGKIQVSLDDVAELSYGTGSATIQPLTTDQLVFANGDTLSGTMLAFSSLGAKWKSSLGILTIPAARIRAINLAQTVPPPVPHGPQIRITCADGTVLITPRLAWDGALLTAYPGGVGPVHGDGRDVMDIDVLNGQLIWLTALPPAGYAQIPYIGSPWPLQTNHNCLGGVLRAKKKTFHHGLGLHSPATLTYDLHGRFTTLTFIPAMDYSARPWGAARVDVLADGKTIFASGILLPGAGMKPTVLDIAGVKTLRFKVAGTNVYGIRARVDLLDAALLK